MGHDIRWAIKTTGELVAVAAKEFDILLTTDRNLSHQQNLSEFNVSVVLLAAVSNRIDDRPLVPRPFEVFGTARIGTATRTGMSHLRGLECA